MGEFDLTDDEIYNNRIFCPRRKNFPDFKILRQRYTVPESSILLPFVINLNRSYCSGKH